MKAAKQQHRRYPTHKKTNALQLVRKHKT